jgi:hypothetical protein
MNELQIHAAHIAAYALEGVLLTAACLDDKERAILIAAKAVIETAKLKAETQKLASAKN